MNQPINNSFIAKLTGQIEVLFEVSWRHKKH